MEIKVLASSSEGNAYIISDGSTRLLIECGLPISELKIKMDFKIPDACLISHAHGDHAKSVNDLMKLGVPCYMSDETAMVADYDTRYGLWRPVEHLHKRQIGSFTVQPLAMEHDIPCLGYLLYSTVLKESVFFATDTCHIPYRLPPTDYIMVEANYDIDILHQRIMDGYLPMQMENRLSRSHMEIDHTLAWLRRQNLTKTKRIYLLHLSHGSSNEAEFKRRAQEETGIPVTIA